jgi:pimeloyl-ACP methyl ester carboxylesterase
MPQVERDGITISYLDEGAGRPLLLLHGHTLDHRAWDDVVPALLEAGIRTIRPDLRGHGSSTLAERGYHWSHHAADMAAVLEHAEVGQAVVVGFSLGGGIALELALAQPAAVAALVLVAPVMPDRPFEAEFMDNLREVARTVHGHGLSAAMRGPWMSSPLFAVSFARPGVRQRVLGMVSDFPGADYMARERDRGDREWKVPDRLGEVDVPTLVVVGERELAGFRGFAEEAVQSIQGARLEVLPDAGHLLPLEHPDVIGRLIIEHVQSCP